MTRFPSNRITSHTRRTEIRKYDVNLSYVENNFIWIKQNNDQVMEPQKHTPLSQGSVFTKIERNQGPDIHATSTPK